jgi:hypothetical protein
MALDLEATLQALRAAGQGVAGSTVGGLAGLGTMMLPGRDADDAAASLEYWQDKLGYQPERVEAQALLHGLEKGGEALEAPFKAAGEFTHELTGSPTLAATVESVPQVLLPTSVIQRGARARALREGPDTPIDPVQTGPGGSQAGIAQVTGTPGQQAMLGKQMPRSTSSLDEQLQAADYELGSSPGVYDTGTPVKQTARGTLTQAERDLIATLPKEQQKAAANMIREYRSTHHPGLGWADVEPLSINITEKGVPKINWRMQAPQFHVESVANKMVDEVTDVIERAGKGDTNAQFITDQARWYRDAENTISDLFGMEGGKLYADIEGSLSPNTRLSQQHVMARDVFDRFMKGDFDETLARFDAHMAAKPDDVSVSQWARKAPDDAIIRKSTRDPDTGELKKYGMNSVNATMALRDLLNRPEVGQAPKMRNFAGNLGGRSVDPTIDVWAGRTAQRLSGGPRVPPATDAGVPGNIAVPKAARPEKGKAASPDITGQYGVASDIFKTAASKLGMDPHDLQALMWFREKELWETQGWTPQDKSPSLVDLIEQDYRKAPPDPAEVSAKIESLRAQ